MFLIGIFDFVFKKNGRCFICQQPTEKFMCLDCIRKLRAYQGEQGFFLYANHPLLFTAPYEGKYKDLLIRFKFKKETHLKKGLAYLMAEAYLQKGLLDREVIVPMPLGKLREEQRGFNQSAKLAAELGYILGLPVAEALGKKDVYPLSRLEGIKREETIKGTMYLQEKANIKNRKILLVDDVFTTGSTMREAIRCLKTGGNNDITVLFFARQRKKNNKNI